MFLEEKKFTVSDKLLTVECPIPIQWVEDTNLDGIYVKWLLKVGKSTVLRHEETILMSDIDDLLLSASYNCPSEGEWVAEVYFIRTATGETWPRYLYQWSYSRPDKGIITSASALIEAVNGTWEVAVSTINVESATPVDVELFKSRDGITYISTGVTDNNGLDTEGDSIVDGNSTFDEPGKTFYRFKVSLTDSRGDVVEFNSNVQTVVNKECLSVDTPVTLKSGVVNAGDINVGDKLDIVVFPDQKDDTHPDWHEWTTDEVNGVLTEVDVAGVDVITVNEYMEVNGIECSLSHVFWALGLDGNWGYVEARYLDTSYKLWSDGNVVDITSLSVISGNLDVVYLDLSMPGLFMAGNDKVLTHSHKVKGN